VGLIAQNSRVEGVGDGLSAEALGCLLGSLAVVNGDLVGVALVDELVAEEFGDDIRVQGRAVVKVVTDGGEGVFLATVKDAKGDLRSAALVEVGSGSSGNRSNTSTYSKGKRVRL
jgi:hypothetical protein